MSTWPEINVAYVNSDGEKLSLSIEDEVYTGEIDYADANMIRGIEGIQVVYDHDEYLLLPPSAEKDGIYYHLFGMNTGLTADDFFEMA